jgi:hypothetical protein
MPHGVPVPLSELSDKYNEKSSKKTTGGNEPSEPFNINNLIDDKSKDRNFKEEPGNNPPTSLPQYLIDVNKQSTDHSFSSQPNVSINATDGKKTITKDKKELQGLNDSNKSDSNKSPLDPLAVKRLTFSVVSTTASMTSSVAPTTTSSVGIDEDGDIDMNVTEEEEEAPTTTSSVGIDEDGDIDMNVTEEEEEAPTTTSSVGIDEDGDIDMNVTEEEEEEEPTIDLHPVATAGMSWNLGHEDLKVVFGRRELSNGESIYYPINDNFREVFYDFSLKKQSEIPSVSIQSDAGANVAVIIQSDAGANVAVIIVSILFISSFLFYCLLLNHSFPTNPNSVTNCFKLFSLLQLYNYICSMRLLF